MSPRTSEPLDAADGPSSEPPANESEPSPVSRPTVLVVDDKSNMLRLMAKVLAPDARVRTADSGLAAIRILEDEHVDAVLCDLKMPDMDGLDVLRACRRLRPRAEFVLMTAYATVDTAVEALKLGAYDYLTKPFEPDAARQVLRRALARVSAAALDAMGEAPALPGVVARSAPMAHLAELVRKIATSDVPTVVLGETGTGKELVARAVHLLGSRSGGSFVALNCSAIPSELLESELFGHARGAFTGATKDRRGLFEAANGGTLFLDEIGDMRLSLQAKLTRVLEERVIRRIGETHEREVDVRLVAATHRDLEAMVAAGSFREDLWYRLNVAVVRLPPLRERSEDIDVLAHHFLREAAERSQRREVPGLTHGAIAALHAYEWPGNVRQLRSAVERAFVLASAGEIDVGDLPPEVARAYASVPAGPELGTITWSEAVERGRAETARLYLEAVLRRFHGNVAEAALQAGVERESFYRLLRRHGVEPAAFRERR